MPGFGRSAAPPAYHWQVAEIAGDFGRFLDAAKIERCHLMGAKYGGSVVTQFAIDHSDRLLSLSLFGSPVRGSGSGNADKIRDLGVRGWAQATMLVPMISHSPVVFWLLPVFGLRGTGYFLATTETIFGVLIFLGYWSPRLGILGALGSIVTYIGTTTIMLFLPGAWAQEAGGFPIFTLPMGFLMKDVLFLVASFYLLKQDLTRAVLEITRS
jgi:pimeloyl-ACP methyl ester carboxylesterase